MPLGSHRQRVPAMLAVAFVGMLIYAVAGAAPGDGRDMAPAKCSTDSGSGTTTTTRCADDDCSGSTTSTTRKGDGGSTTTTGKDGDSTSTTRKGDSTTTTGKGSTTTTGKDDGGGKGDDGSAGKAGSDGSDGEDGSGREDGKDGKDGADGDDASGKDGDDDKSADAKAAAADDDPAGKDCGSTTSTTRRDGCSTSTTAKGDKASTTTTAKDGKCPTTTTTRKGGDDGDDKPTTTTTKPKPTTTSTTRSSDPGTDPGSGPGGDPPGGTGPDAPGGPGTGLDTPMEPQFIPDPADPDPGPSTGPEDTLDPGEEFDWTYEGSPSGGPIGPTGEDAPTGPMAVPGAAPSVLPMFGDLFPGSGGKPPAARAERRRRDTPARSSGRVQEVASSPRVSARIATPPSPAVTESGRVSRSLAGLRASANESAFPAEIIATPKVFPVNRWDPLAAAALVIVAGLAREGIRTWRRRATQLWPM